MNGLRVFCRNSQLEASQLNHLEQTRVGSHAVGRDASWSPQMHVQYRLGFTMGACWGEESIAAAVLYITPG
eukprot:58803-Chlamydomonas_euryale.AAC.4